MDTGLLNELLHRQSLFHKNIHNRLKELEISLGLQTKLLEEALRLSTAFLVNPSTGEFTPVRPDEMYKEPSGSTPSRVKDGCRSGCCTYPLGSAPYACRGTHCPDYVAPYETGC
jgi:hypothetical protein